MNEVEKKGIGKVGVGLIICATLVSVLTISSVLFYVRNNALQTTVNVLKAEIYDLQTDKYDLQSQVGFLTTENDDLQDEVDDLTTENNWLNLKYDNYVANHQYSDWEYEDIQFYFYYVEPEQKFGVYDLDDELFGWEWYIPYEEGVFDCSEMSAYLEWYLENEGWNTLIVVGDSPSGSGYHAWLLVETSEGAYMPVESITAEIVWWEDPYFDNYWIYDDTFETIQDALDYYETEFDWWM